MELGFETIGNATLICHDRVPILVTDPWLKGSAYFGSWGLSHEIPPEIIETIKLTRFVWISHGHPDHLSSASLKLLRKKRILLPHHVGGRIKDALLKEGYDVTVLKDYKWCQLSDRIRVLSIADYNQDAVLLIDIGGRLIVNLNDAGDRGWGPFVKRIIRNYEVTFLLRLIGFGDADMINYRSEDGRLIKPMAAHRRPVGEKIARQTLEWRTRYFVPFSSMHVYQRQDSIWANEYRTDLSSYGCGFDSRTSELLPSFIRYDLIRDRCERINPREQTGAAFAPKDFGDDWSETLEAADKAQITRYFKSISHLEESLDFITMRVGGEDHIIELAKRLFKRGITFEAPRHSLMISIDNEIFDDMLIGNFMKTTLHGKFGPRGLYPDFTPYVAKYADNGLAKTREELHEYFKHYMQRAPLAYLKHRIEKRPIQFLKYSLPPESPIYKTFEKTYFYVKGLRLLR